MNPKLKRELKEGIKLYFVDKGGEALTATVLLLIFTAIASSPKLPIFEKTLLFTLWVFGIVWFVHKVWLV